MEKVEQFYNKNQFLIRGDAGITFQSYDSTIANIDSNGNLTLFRDWDYSKTTLKHLYLFLNDYVHRLKGNEATEKLKNIICYSKNKRKDIQELIDTKSIKYIRS